MSLIDIHSHLLPKVDDSKLSKFSFSKMMKSYREAGIENLCFSPHINNPYVDTKMDKIEPTFAWASEKAKKEGINTYLGCELYITEGELPQKFYPLFSRFVLCETNVDFAPKCYLDSLRKIKDKGYEIIIAHIERYNWLDPESETFRVMKEELGVLVQINASSSRTSKANEYLTKGLVDFIASDNHGKFEHPKLLVEILTSNPRAYQKMNNFIKSI